MENNIVFIAGSREISFKRLKAIISAIPKDKKIAVGFFSSNFIEGMDGSLQFRTLKLTASINKYLTALNVNIIKYNYRDTGQILLQLNPLYTIFINGSWQYAFHRTEFYNSVIVPQRLKYKQISPFLSENEAKIYCESILSKQPAIDLDFKSEKKYILKKFKEIKSLSWDWNFQVGAFAVKENKIVEYGYNTVLPYESYALHFGSLREKKFSKSGDSNNHDTLHAEIYLFLRALNAKKNLNGADLYCNLLPCHNCALAIAKSGIKRVFYVYEYNSEHTKKILENSGKIVEKLNF